MIRALTMMIRDEALALKLTPDLQQRLFHVLQAEHLDVHALGVPPAAQSESTSTSCAGAFAKA